MALAKRWVKAVGINKSIPWQCSRQSFAVSFTRQESEYKDDIKLMGHCGISMTDKYIHVLDRQKKAAIDSLGPIGFAM